MKQAAIILLIVLSACTGNREKADLILYNGHIYTVDSAFTIAEAVAVRDGRILATGTSKDIRSRFKSDKEEDLNGAPLYPGFIDAHCHFTGYATDMWKCNLTGTRSFNEVLGKIAEYAKTTQHPWIYGRGWDQNDWERQEFPEMHALDSMFPDRPVFLKRIDGHAALVNSTALKLCGVDASTHVEGGTVEVKNGRLTGILIDNAMDLVDLKIPAIDDSLARGFFLRAQETCFRSGLTSVHDCGVSEHTVDLVDAEQRAGRLKMKVFALLSDNPQYYDKWIRRGVYKTGRLTVGGFKIYADGALGSRGACLHHDYSDQPGWKGFMLTEKKRVGEIAARLADSPFQMCTHAIGDSANSMILDIYEAALAAKPDRRWRIEHAQVMREQDFGRFRKNGIIPSVQPTHATSDMYWAEKRLGKERLPFAYAYKRLLDEAGIVALGTDFPVEDISPFKTFYAAVARKDSAGFPAGGFNYRDALTREETLKGMTVWAARSVFEERTKGTITAGAMADFVVLDKDLLKCPEKEILKTRVLSTWSNGECVYRQGQSSPTQRTMLP